MSNKTQYTFTRHDHIGAAAAEDDATFLDSCFVDIGDIDVLSDTTNPKMIVVGRTGAGKSAVLKKLVETKSAISIDPEALSLNYVANSPIVKFFAENNVNLDPFFKLLWRHLFAVEVFKSHENLLSQNNVSNFFTRLVDPSYRKESKISQKARSKALEYMQQYGESFWEDTEYRAKEITKHFEEAVKKDLKGGLKAGSDVPGTSISTGLEIGGVKSSESKKTVTEHGEIIRYGQEVVQSIQVRQLSGIFELVNAVLHGSEKKYIFVIDRLDDNWVDENLRYRLIRSLIDTAGEFRSVPNVKIVVSMRTDLLDRVFRQTRGSGYQEEKYRSMFLPLEWDRQELSDLVRRRVAAMVKDKHGVQKVRFDSVFPSTVVPKNSVSKNRSNRTFKAIDYFIDRTWYRPRDLIEFVNYCIIQARQKSQITSTMIQEAEGQYSRSRLRSLGDEWQNEYPLLIDTIMHFLSGSRASFDAAQVDLARVESFIEKYTDKLLNKEIGFGRVVNNYITGELDIAGLRSRIFYAFYRTGACGIKPQSFLRTDWIGPLAPSLSPHELTSGDFRVHVHPALWRVLGIQSTRHND